MNLDATLHRLAADPTEPVDLATLALHLAADEYPRLDVAEYEAQLDELADAVRPRIVEAEVLPAQVAELCRFLFDEEGFSGNQADYYHPRNSYLNDVLDRRLGLPLSLTVLAVAVGRRCGLEISPVGLPGHVVGRAEDEFMAVLFDPFHGGRFLDVAGCEELVEAVTGRPFRATPTALAATPPGAVAVRLLTNLKGVYLKRGDFARAARVIGRLVQLAPNDPSQRRDWGVSLLRADRPGQAIDPLRAYLKAVPAADDAAAVRDFLRQAERVVAGWN